jgi:SWI/SNF-related matrix-associated actin-dependent regulator of chromatin subfamily A3
LVEPAPPTELTQAPIHDPDEEEEEVMDGKSDKITQLVHLLQLIPVNDKSLVFSQFTGFLDKVSKINLRSMVSSFHLTRCGTQIEEELNAAG